ncbi:clathrin light chain [Chlamydoabsidia padenii]|nr:clathrin light chain [Chlamydoabsidia padenii]
MSDYIGSPNTTDPTTDFLARERAALGDDADFFTDHANLTPSPSFMGTPDLPSPSAILTPTLTNTGTDDLIQQSNQVSQFESSYPSADQLESSQAFHNAMLPDEEPETVKQWRENQNEILAERDEEAAKKKQDTIKKAHEDIDKFYEDYNEKKQKAIEEHRQQEEQIEKDKDDADANVWERVLKQCNTGAADGLSRTGDVTRMKEIMLGLKNTKDAPGSIV